MTGLVNLLDGETFWSKYGGLILIIVFIALFVGMMILNRFTQKKRQQETENMLNAIQPGNKVKTIGGICGVVVEVCPEDNTFVLETGTEASGKSYIKFDKQAVYQTDAVATPAPVEETATEPVPAEEVFEEVKAEENVETTSEEPVQTTEETKE